MILSFESLANNDIISDQNIDFHSVWHSFRKTAIDEYYSDEESTRVLRYAPSTDGGVYDGVTA